MSWFRHEPWRIDPDHRQDRSNGPVIIYKLGPEELKKYESIKGNGKKPIILASAEEVRKIRERERGNKIMKQTKITKEQLIEECRNLGFSKEAYQKIAEKYGLTVKEVGNKVSAYRIRKLIEQQAREMIRQAVAV